MPEVAIMVEGQNGLNWPRWQRIASAVEALSFAGLYRSDHFVKRDPPNRDSLDLWASLTWLASHTQRIQFGPLVSPVSFRNPVATVITATAVDDLSGGRLTLGLGAGWQAREHEMYGFDLLDIPQRFARFREALTLVKSLLTSAEPISFDGRFFRLREASILPRPQRPCGPPILIGGNGPRYTLPLAAEFADEWNAAMIPPAQFAALNTQLDTLLAVRGRQPGAVQRSLMTEVVFGRNDSELRRKLEGRSAAELRERGVLVGGASELVAQLGALGDMGVQRVMLQWLDLDDLAGLEALAHTVLPQL